MYWNVGLQGHSPSTALTVVGRGPRPGKVGLRTLATYIPIINTINRLFHVKHFCLHMGTMVQMYKMMFHVKHCVSKFILLVVLSWIYQMFQLLFCLFLALELPLFLEVFLIGNLFVSKSCNRVLLLSIDRLALNR